MASALDKAPRNGHRQAAMPTPAVPPLPLRAVVGACLRAVREAAGLTQLQAAVIWKVSRQTVGAREAGDPVSPVPLDELVRLAVEGQDAPADVGRTVERVAALVAAVIRRVQALGFSVDLDSERRITPAGRKALDLAVQQAVEAAEVSK